MELNLPEELLFPEPQFARKNFYSLNGAWEVSLSGGAWRAVKVPYCIESELSGMCFCILALSIIAPK